MDQGHDGGSSDVGVTVDRRGGVVTITLDRPSRRNALSASMMVAITNALEATAADDEARVVALRARGDHFCSGAEIGGDRTLGLTGEDQKPPRPRTGHMQRSLQQGAHRLIRTFHEIPLPVVVGVRGWAAGIGNALALSGDHVVAARSARFWAPFVTRGFTPDSATTYLLPRLVGMQRAKEMVLRGRPVDGETAAAWGLVAEVVDDDGLDAAVDAVVAEYAKGATVAIGLAKSLLHRNVEVGLVEALHNEELAEELAIRSDDFKEGMRAFGSRTDPEYTGR